MLNGMFFVDANCMHPHTLTQSRQTDRISIKFAWSLYYNPVANRESGELCSKKSCNVKNYFIALHWTDNHFCYFGHSLGVWEQGNVGLMKIYDAIFAQQWCWFALIFLKAAQRDSARDNISVNTRKVKRESMALATHFRDCTSIIASARLENSKHKNVSWRRIFTIHSEEFNRRAIGIWCEYRWELTTEPRQSGIEIEANKRASVSLRDIIYEWYKAHWISTPHLRRFLFNRPPSVPSVKTVWSEEKK